METLRCKKDIKFFVFYLFVIFVYHLVISFQGYDMADEGWVMTGYQQIFNDPMSVKYQFLYYFSIYIGGMWNVLFGDLGYWGFRLFAVIIRVLTAAYVYKIFEGYLNKWCILVGVLLSCLCSSYGLYVYEHDHLTILMVVMVVYYMAESLKKGKLWYMGVAGILLGVNVFSRLPNISMTLLILIVIPYWIYDRNIVNVLKILGYAVGGFVIGIILTIGLMLLSGHFEIFMQNMKESMTIAFDENSYHSFDMLIKTNMNSIVYQLRSMVLIWAIPIVVFVMGKVKCVKWLKYLLVIILLPLYISFIYGNGSNIGSIYAFVSPICVVAIFSKNKAIVYLSVLSFIVMHLLPLGSDGSIWNMGEHSIWLALPLAVGCIWKWGLSLYTKRCREIVGFVILLGMFMLMFTTRNIIRIMNGCYFDDGSRFDKVYRINHPLATTYTTKRNCELLNPMLTELCKYVKKDDYLLCFQNIPTVHYLTQTRPYLYNSWVWTYTSSNFKYQMELAEKEHDYLPIVVRDKSMLPTWYNYYPDWNNEKGVKSYFHDNDRIMYMNDFLRRNNYVLVWENEVFQILKPQPYALPNIME